MILYNVTVKVNPEINDEWVKWMKEEHMPALMNIGLFVDAKLMQILELDDRDGITYAAQYYCKGVEQYQAYIDNHASRFRKEGIDRFGEKFVAFRSIMKSI